MLKKLGKFSTSADSPRPLFTNGPPARFSTPCRHGCPVRLEHSRHNQSQEFAKQLFSNVIVIHKVLFLVILALAG